MQLILPNFKSGKVIIIGDIILDQYLKCINNNSYLENISKIFKINLLKYRPGGAANVAMNIASLGCSSNLFGITGIDKYSKILTKILIRNKIKYNLISINSYPTITKSRLLFNQNHILRMDYEKKFNNINSKIMLKNIKKNILNSGAIVISDYNKGSLYDIKSILDISIKNHIPIIVDTKNNDFNIYKGCTVLTPNEFEFKEYVGSWNNEKEMINLGIEVVNYNKLNALIITRSENGLLLIESNKNILNMPSYAYKVRDVTGAGDTFTGVLASALSLGISMKKSCFLANIAAGLVVSNLFTSTINIDDFKNFILNKKNII
ncbi:MAG: PfkB family carbohydrate kinase [Candidatus Makana argininalis]